MNHSNTFSLSFPEAKTIIVSGDIHGDLNQLVFKLCIQYKLKDTLLIVAGDCGFGFEKKEYYEQMVRRNAKRMNQANNWIVFVRGNHDNPAYFDGTTFNYKRFIAVPDLHEAGAIEASGHKVLTLPQHEGKLCAEEVEAYIADFYRDETYEHMVAPGMVYISHPTEYGTLYSLSELEALSRVCRKANIPLYMDGARLGYGLAAPGTDVTLQDIARLCDVFYIGGTKVGALFGEAVVAPHAERLPHFFPLIKQHGALLAKGRLLGIQFETLFTDGLYLEMGKHAVRLAQKLKQGFVQKGYKLHMDSPTNQQFVCLPNADIDRLSAHATFELWGPRGEEETVVRFVTSWATREADVDALIDLL